MPEHIDAWRPKQEAALHLLSQSPKRVKALCMPTGSGKTAVYVADALRQKQRPTCFVTDSRALQDQLIEEFGPIGLVDIRGRSNYPCGMRPEDPDYTCEHGYASRCPMKGTHHCPASQSEMRAAASSLVVTNYDKWIHARRYGQGLAHIQRVVFDEGHEAPSALGRAMQVVLHQKEVEETLGIDFPPASDALFFSTWRPWAAKARAVCELMMVSARTKLLDRQVKASWVRHFTHLRNLSRRLAILASANPNNWVVEELPRAYQFDPIAPAIYAESALLLKVMDITVISATLRPKTLYMMGISHLNFEFEEFLSDFDPVRCPFYYVPTMQVDSRQSSLAPLWIMLDQIAARRRDRNGIVHTMSYIRRDDVLAHSRYAASMFVNERGEPATAMVDAFKASYPGSILVSPSVGQGFDFAFKAAEWQFIAKVPFPPPSKILKARTELDKELPYYLAMQKLVQAAGRLMRAPTDQGETIMGDDHLKWFLPRYAHLAPKSFGQFFQRIESLPTPPPRLP